MTDYISREEARELMYHNQDSLTEYDLNSIPAADVKPVVRGEWHEFEYGKCLCSECGQVYSKEFAAVVSYCAKCGAEMKEGTR